MLVCVAAVTFIRFTSSSRKRLAEGTCLESLGHNSVVLQSELQLQKITSLPPVSGLGSLGFEILAQFHCAMPSINTSEISGEQKTLCDCGAADAWFFIICPTHTGRHAELRRYKAMSLFRCQHKSL